MQLNRRGRALLAQRSRVAVTLRIAPKGAPASTAKLTLKRVEASAERGGKDGRRAGGKGGKRGSRVGARGVAG